MPSTTTAPYGTWSSLLSVDVVTQSSLNFSTLSVDAASSSIYCIESRPSESGRSVIVKHYLNGHDKEKDIFGQGWNARSGVHEYGGGAMTARDGVVWFSDYGSSRIYTVVGEKVEPFTPENKVHRFADFKPHPTDSSLLASVLEDHTHPEPANVVNSLVILRAGQPPHTVASGSDFYAFPRWSPDGKYLAWTQWNHPNMPWDGSILHVTEVTANATTISVSEPIRVAGVEGEVSITQPIWASSTQLLFQCDVSGFYNPWMFDVTTRKSHPLLSEPLLEECASPDWTFGNSSLSLLSSSTFLMASTTQGIDRLHVLALTPSPKLRTLTSSFVTASQLHAVSSRQAVFLGATNTAPASLILISFTGDPSLPDTPYTFETLKSPSATSFPDKLFAPAVPRTLTTPDGPVHVLYYSPNNPDFVGPSDEKPPCIINAHGGPTSRADAGLNILTQFFTTRGFAWVDVNYGGSTGYGKQYRNLLDGQWGIVDIRDSAACVAALDSTGLIDPKRVAIRGRSAGGYTVLAALCKYPDVFSAGVSLYGISDLAMLAEDTHKFELRYCEKLLGGTPESAHDNYYQRSPINNAENIKAPLLLLQGSVDPVVPPSQAKLILEKVKNRGGKVECLIFEGEGHGWRRADTMKTALQKELEWYESLFINL